MGYDFDGNGNLLDLNYQKSGGSSVARYQYTYDNNNMRTGMTDNDGTHNYAYDSLYQIIEATHPTPPRPLEQFEYDAAGNRLGGGRVHNELNQLVEDDTCVYIYDADGNMTARVNKLTGDSTIFTWDIENKLVEVRKTGMIARYTYDAFGRRMSKEVNGVKTQFRYDGQDLILEMDANDTITANYTFGPGIDNPLMMRRGSANYYYVKDGLGSVTSLTDSNATVVKEYLYSVFGEIVEETGDSIENPFTYTSRELDKETGNYFYRMRYYDPGIGRFISEDPIWFGGGDVNFYRYVRNNTINRIDPLGLKPGDIYPTELIAVLNALAEINPISIKKNKEYAGWIYKNVQGGWSYTVPQKVGKDWSNPGLPPPNYVAYYHTHGAYDPCKGNL